MTWAVWPVGLILTFAHAEAHLLPTPVFLILDVAYIGAVTVVARRVGAASTWLIAPGVMIFSLAALTGVPTATRPGAMVANAAVLGLAAAALLTSFVLLGARVWNGPGRGAGAVAVTVLAVGTTGYLANLLARFAVVLSGAAPGQAAVEDRAWQAHAYLQGLDGPASLPTVLLVWLDLLQLAYVVLAYLSTALLAVALHRAGSLPVRPARAVVALGVGLAAAATVGAALGSAGASVGPAAAGVAFALTIPFMSTVLPALLGAALQPDPDGHPDEGPAAVGSPTPGVTSGGEAAVLA
jgi:hypothetical protein